MLLRLHVCFRFFGYRRRFVEEMVKHGCRLQISFMHVEKQIKVQIGADKRTMRKCMKMLIEDLGFLKVVTKNPFWNLHLQDRYCND
jgi:hypothetical protein